MKSYMDRYKENNRKMAIEALIGVCCMAVAFALMIWGMVVYG
jgi:hypothetical protein